MGTEKNNEYYDKIYSIAKKYRRHYSGVRWLPMFEKATEFIGDNILEIGCGVGQFAHLLYNTSKPKYVGVDFSEVAIQRAKSLKLQGYEFYIGDIYKKEWYEREYDTIVALETLEHVEDFKVIELFPKGKNVVISLPTFPCESHLVYFKSEKEIEDRYKHIIEIENIHKIQDWFLFNGKKI